MTHNSEQASANASTTHPTTKSHCPEGAGLNDPLPAQKSAHTPPQACAAPPHCATAQQIEVAPHAQLAEGYKHTYESVEEDADAHIHPADRAEIERQHQAMADKISSTLDGVLDGLIPFQDRAYRTGYERAARRWKGEAGFRERKGVSAAEPVAAIDIEHEDVGSLRMAYKNLENRHQVVLAKQVNIDKLERALESAAFQLESLSERFPSGSIPRAAAADYAATAFRRLAAFRKHGGDA